MNKNKQQHRPVRNSRVSLKNGISFQPGIDMSIKTRVFSFFPVIQVLVTLISSLSVIYMLPAFLYSDNGSYTGNYCISNGSTVFIVSLLTSLAALLCTCRERFLKFIGASYLVLNAGYILLHIRGAVDGFMHTANVYSKCASFAQPLFAQKAANATTGEIEIFLLTLAFVITLLTSFGCIFHLSFPVEFLATFPVFELMTFWGMHFNEDYTWTIIGMLFSWVLVLSLSMINHTARSKDPKCTFAIHRRRKTYYMTSEKVKNSFFGLMTYALMLISLSVFIVTIGYIHAKDDIRTKKINRLRYEISTGVKNFSRDISEQAEIKSKPIPGRGTKVMGGTNGGRLGLYDELKFHGRNAMRVYTPQFYRPLYLRGYAGESYTDNTWSPVKNNSKPAITFKRQYGGCVLDYNFIHTYYNTYPGTPHFSLTIDPLNCSEDLIYAPYGAYYSQIDIADEQHYDGMISPVSEEYGSSYEILMLPIADDTSSWQDIIYEKENFGPGGPEQEALKEYDNVVIHQEDSIFLKVPEQLAPSVDKIISETGLTAESDINDIEDAVKSYFNSNGYTYDLKPGVTPEGEDFIKYFLDVQKKGYCTYFASAGVMIMRRLGIPARYVEGYVIEPSQYTPDNKGITVTDRSAHAWCEVFIDGCGWYPVEFTPGYQNDNPNLTDSDKNIKKDPKPKQTVSVPEKNSKPDSSSSKAAALSTPDKNNSNASSSKAKTESKSSKGGGAAGTESGSGKGGGKKPNDRRPDDAGGSKTDITQMMYILLTVGFIAAMPVIAAVRRKACIAKMYKENNSPDNRKSAISCYTSFLKYVKLLGIDDDENLTDVQLAGRVSEKLKEKMPDLCGAFSELSDTALMAYMSEQDISDEESAHARMALNSVQERTFQLLNLPQKLIATWILGLF